MKKSSSIYLLPLLFFISCETEISGPVETIPEVNGVQLEWIGYQDDSYEYISGDRYYQGRVWYTGEIVPNTLSSYPSYSQALNNYGNYVYSANEWFLQYSCTEIELFQSEGYFNYKYIDNGIEVVQSNSISDSHFWIEK